MTKLPKRDGRLRQPSMAIGNASATAAAESVIEGYMSAVDTRGDHAVWLVKTRPDGVLQFCARYNDPKGLFEVFVRDSSREAVQKDREDLERRWKQPMIPADWHYCDFLVHRAFGWAVANKGRIKGDYRGLRAEVTTQSAQETESPVRAVLDIGSVRNNRRLLAGSAKLLGEMEFYARLFDRTQVAQIMSAVSNIALPPTGRVLLDRSQRGELERAAEHVLELFFGKTMHASWARRLELMAYFFLSTHRHRAARRALAVALALEQNPTAARDIPFCRAFAFSNIIACLKGRSSTSDPNAAQTIVAIPVKWLGVRYYDEPNVWRVMSAAQVAAETARREG